MQNPRKDAKHPVKEEEQLRARAMKLERIKRKTSRSRFARIAHAGDEKVEEALRRSEEHFRRLYEQAPLSYQSLDAQGRLREVNRAWLDLFGYSRDEVLGCWFGDFLAPHEVDAYKERFPRIKATGEVHVDLEVVRRDNSTIYVHIDGIIARDERGQFKQTHCILKDITELKRAQQTIEKERYKLRMYFENLPALAYNITLDGLIEDCNQVALETLGYANKEELIGKPLLTTIYPPSSQQRALELFNKWKKEGKLKNEEIQIVTRQGQIIDALLNVTTIFDHNGEPMHSLSTHTVITERKLFEESLKMSEFRIRSLIEQTTDAVFCYEYNPPIPTDLPVEEQLRLLYDGVLVECNEVCARSYGACRPEEVLGKKLTELFGTTPGSLDKLFTTWITGGYHVVDGEGVKKLEDGSERYYLNNGHGVIEDGKLTRVWGTFRNITERKRAEEALRESERKLRSIIDHSIEVFYIHNTEHELTYVSPQSTKVFGYTPEEMAVKWTTLTTDASINKKGFELTERAINTGKKQRPYLLEIRRKDGEPRIVEIDESPIKDEEGKVIAISGALRDVTERKNAEEALRDSEEKYRSVIENANIGVIVIQDGRRVFHNSRIPDLYGYTEEEYNDIDFMSIIHPEDRSYVADRIRQKLSGELANSDAIEIRTISTSGEIKWVEANSTVIQWEGKPAVQAFVTDITERKSAEEERELMIELLRLLHSDNQKHELMRLVTKLLKDWSGCDAVGIRLQEGDDFPYYVTSGFPEEFVSFENSLCAFDETGELVRDSEGKPYLECMCGNIISGRFNPAKPFFTEYGSFWTNSTMELLTSTTETDRLARTRNRCNTAGYESVALVPLRVGRKTFGLLQFNDKQKGHFTPGKISVFERLADNLAIGLAQRKAEEALRESERRYRVIFEQAADTIVLINAETEELLEFNDTAYENLGYTREEFQKLKILDFEVIESAEAVTKHIEKIVRAGRDTFETKHRTKDGRIRDIQVSSRAISIGGRNFVQSIWYDVTERKKAEDELRKYQARLKAMASQLSSIQERQRRQLAVELHDRITQSLAIVKLGLQTLVGTIPDTDAATRVKEIAEQVGSTMEDAYSLMLELSNPVLYEIGLKAAVETLLQSDLVKSSGIKCRLVAPKEFMKIDTDTRVVLYQTIRELLVNAIKHSKAMKIEVHLYKTHETASITVRDDGIGFDPSNLKLPGKEGGFGLFNIRENIGSIGGEFTIESKPGEGTSATAWAPLHGNDSQSQKEGPHENTDCR